eukprot:TRINITY_DN2477_c0_g1_i1.p1 TRINITY_DN2477_c0_g1~~TRINITY_DN2477_c0_g1_i1.p1  ORF type:complete len:561 (-),score=58.77 TRINITY_DN2477_c0_g1_i1:1158-2840(-)
MYTKPTRKRRYFLYFSLITFAIWIWLVIYTPASTPRAVEARLLGDTPESLYQTMTPTQRVGQLLMVSFPGSRMNGGITKLLHDLQPGGVILCPFNVDADDDAGKFLSALQRAVQTPLLISADQEGGRSMRDPFSENQHVTRFPSSMAFGAVGSRDYAYRWGKILGRQLRGIGVNMNLAPVLDINNNPLNPVINTRSFGMTADVVTELGVAYMQGLQDAGCAAVGKHFPGHGDTTVDSHEALPAVNVSMSRLEDVELRPFVAAVDGGLSGVMAAHITYPRIFADGKPATLSHFWLTDWLRHKLKFDGVILTDDMKMQAIKLPVQVAVVQTILAGSDLIVSTQAEHARSMQRALQRAVTSGELSEDRLRQSVLRILRLKEKLGLLNTSRAGVYPTTRGIQPSDLEFNINVSRAALVYAGNMKFLHPIHATRRIFIITNPVLRKQLRLRENDLLFTDTQAWLSSLKHFPNSDEPQTILYLYYFLLPTDLEDVIRFARKRIYHVIGLCSGSPFQLVHQSEVFDGILYSFGNTPHQLLAMSAALEGTIQPRLPTEIHNLSPGLLF